MKRGRDVSNDSCSASFICFPKSRNEKLRILVVLCLIGTIVLAGYFPYTFFTYLERSRASEEYRAVVAVAEISFQQGLSNKIAALGILDTLFQTQCPLASQWPNCSITPLQFDTVSASITDIAEVQSIGMAPVVHPSEVQALEKYVSSTVYLANGITEFGMWKYPNSTTRGIAAVNVSTRQIYHATEPSPLSDLDFLLPVVHFTGTTYRVASAESVLLDIYTESIRVKAIEYAVNCADKNDGGSCDAISDFVVPLLNFRIAPAATTVHPVTINNKVRAIVFSTHYWSSVISQSLPDHVRGIDVVISTGTTTYTYTYNKGKVDSPRVGDTHERQHHNTKRSLVGILEGNEVQYVVSYYATDNFFHQFRDGRAIYACIIGLTIAIVTTFMFFLYDLFLSRTARENEVILSTKRAFVRYISHEIRTPLNTVNVGLKVLYQELQSLPYLGEDLLENMSDALIRLGDDEVITSDITTVSGNRSPLKPDCKKDELMRLVMEIEESSDAAVDILNDLINFDKISMGTMRLEVQPLNIWEFLDTATSPFLLQARQKGVVMVLDLEPTREGYVAGDTDIDRVRVIADAVKLTQVMRNLLSNALKFTPSGGSITVTANWHRAENPGVSPSKFMRESLGDCSAVSVGNIVVSVTDTGVGLSAEHQRHLFQEGRQFNANRLQGGEGSGLGLYIAKGVVVLHDGTLSAYSAGEGTGCTFTMVLPAVQIQWNDSADAHSLEEGISLQSMIPFMSERAECEYKLPTVSKSIGVSEDSREVIRHVLVVDDSIPSRKMIARLLSNAGYDCQQACDGQECVDIMVRNREDPSASRIQLIFMDYEMPRINGPEACEILRNKGFTIPIIGVTGNVLPADCDYFISHGASVVLAKPLDLNKLNRVFMQFS